jgi:two-component system, OmpR family, phosphate regulon sensor histidine kinase PhoR
MNDGEAAELMSLIRSPFAAKLVEAMPEPAVIVGPGGRVSAANEPALTLLPGLKAGEPFVRALRAPDVVDARRRAMATGKVERVQWSERVPVERLFDVTIAPLSTAGNEVVATLLTLRDLTELKGAERMRVDFIANASHELRTPLASLLGFIETLQGSAHDDPKARDRFLAIMGEQGRRMARLIEDLLSLSRIEQKQHVRPVTTVDLTQTVRSVVDALSPMAEELGATISLSAPEAVLVTGDRDELLRVAENLVENAIKYGVPMEAGNASQVDVLVGKTDRDAVLTVRDYGHGIASEHLPRLTERFYRVDATQSRARNGTGLGLAIVKHILTRHRGRLTISSRIGEGSSFVATVPLHPGKAPVYPSAAPAEGAPRGPRRRPAV